MPLFGEVPLFNVYFGEPQHFLDEFSQDVMSLDNFDPDDAGSRQVDLNFLANIILRVIFALHQSCLLKGILLVGVVKL